MMASYMPKIGLDEKNSLANPIKCLAKSDDHTRTGTGLIQGKKFSTLVASHDAERHGATTGEEKLSDDASCAHGQEEASQFDGAREKVSQKKASSSILSQEQGRLDQGKHGVDEDKRLEQLVAALPEDSEDDRGEDVESLSHNLGVTADEAPQKEQHATPQDWSLAALMQLHQVVGQVEATPQNISSSAAQNIKDENSIRNSSAVAHKAEAAVGSVVASAAGGMSVRTSTATAFPTESIPSVSLQNIEAMLQQQKAKAPHGEEGSISSAHIGQNNPKLANSIGLIQRDISREVGTLRSGMGPQPSWSTASVQVVSVVQNHIADMAKSSTNGVNSVLKGNSLNVLGNRDSLFGVTLAMSPEGTVRQGFKGDDTGKGNTPSQEGEMSLTGDDSSKEVASAPVVGTSSFAHLIANEVNGVRGDGVNAAVSPRQIGVTHHNNDDIANSSPPILTTGTLGNGRSSTLNMTVLTQDESPVRVQVVHSMDGLSALSLQGADESTTSVLQKSRRDLAHQLDIAGVRANNVKIDVLPADMGGMADGQGNTSANSHHFHREGEGQAGASFGDAQTGSGGQGGQHAYPQYQQHVEQAMERGQAGSTLTAALSDDAASDVEGETAQLHLTAGRTLANGGLNISV